MLLSDPTGNLQKKKSQRQNKGEKKTSLQFDNFFWEIKMENSDIADFQPYPDIFVKLPDFLSSMPD